jgi:hypothetical protein
MNATMRPLPPALAALVVANAVGGTVCVLAGLSLATDSGGDRGAAAAGSAASAFGLLAGLAAFLLRRRRRSGRLLQVGLAVAGLPVLPFWSIASAGTLWTMSRPGMRALLSGRREEEWTPAEAAAASALSAPSKSRAALLATGLLVLAALEGAFLASLPPRGSADRAKQKRTVADLRSAMTAVESFAAREGRYPEASSIDELARLLEPGFIPRLPRVDAWGRPLRYESWRSNEASPGLDAYLLASAGRDGAWETNDLKTAEPRAVRSPDDDLLVRDGQFVLAPDLERPSPPRQGTAEDGSAGRTAKAHGS